MKLIIFDLDQTLVDFLSVHNVATQKLFRRFFDADARLTEIDFAGKSLTDNFRDLARAKNVPEGAFQKASQKLLESYETAFGENLPTDAVRHILPGAKELLSELSKTDHVVALYTGDSPGIVDLVLGATDLGRYFKFCLYGTEVKTRADMVKLAIEKAERMTEHEFKDKNVVIIGDSIRDMECGKLYNAMTIGVATGFHSREQLVAAGADYVFDSLKEYEKVLRLIG